MVGLIEAIDKYNPENLPAFASYAQIRIQGAMLDDLRQQDWVPRSVRDRSNQIAKAKKALIQNSTENPVKMSCGILVYVSGGFSTLHKESRCSCPFVDRGYHWRESSYW